eukprot:TRINITY_DN470_c0_g1_i2.p1 TRINITY_DN470_c0_g1~~TRINITY_DN470_c0_g1_i2.p1  ORF type:complete len:138 (+),score=12.73 TRINITY_DN470_c0_g1_i2:523-936(+)
MRAATRRANTVTVIGHSDGKIKCTEEQRILTVEKRFIEYEDEKTDLNGSAVLIDDNLVAICVELNGRRNQSTGIRISEILDNDKNKESLHKDVLNISLARDETDATKESLTTLTLASVDIDDNSDSDSEDDDHTIYM